MRPLLALLLLLPGALLAQDNPSYDPDYNGDGCYSIADILGLLPLFGSCEPWQCGDSTEFDGYWYETVLIGDQCWFAENLRTTKYANGDSIPAGLTGGEWSTTTSGATAVYGEGSSICSFNYSPDFDACDEAQSLAEYGRLYNWYAVDDARGLCPAGWHVPTDGEWTELEDYIISQGFTGGFPGTIGIALKSTSGWYISSDCYDGSGNGTDDFGFSALPGGYHYGEYDKFANAGLAGAWWSSTSQSDGFAWARDLSNCNGMFFRGVGIYILVTSVRCLKDAE